MSWVRVRPKKLSGDNFSVRGGGEKPATSAINCFVLTVSSRGSRPPLAPWGDGILPFEIVGCVVSRPSFWYSPHPHHPPPGGEGWCAGGVAPVSPPMSPLCPPPGCPATSWQLDQPFPTQPPRPPPSPSPPPPLRAPIPRLSTGPLRSEWAGHQMDAPSVGRVVWTEAEHSRGVQGSMAPCPLLSDHPRLWSSFCECRSSRRRVGGEWVLFGSPEGRIVRPLFLEETLQCTI